MRIEVREGCLVRRFGPEGAPLVLCVHGFADDGTVFLPLRATHVPLAFAAVDLPGFGASPPVSWPGLQASAAAVARIVEALGGPVVLLAHSMGGPVAVEAARLAAARVAGLVSLEGNMTAADAYLSRRALRHEDPRAFHNAFVDAVWRRAAEDPARRRAASAVLMCDPLTLWRHGRDVAAREGDAFGEAYAALPVPTLYVFDRASTPAETARFVEQRGLAAHELEGAGHFPTVTAPDRVAALLTRFVEKR